MDVPRGTPDAVLRPTGAEPVLDVRRLATGTLLSGLVDYHWYVGWRTAAPHEQQVLAQPRVHVAAEHGRLLVHGIAREPFVRTLTGVGHTLGAAFHPGGFRPPLGRSVGSIAGRVLPAADLLGADDRPAARRILGTTDVAVMVEAMEDYLGGLEPPDDPVVRDVRDLVAQAERDRSLTRAEELAGRAGTSLRTLQRLFTDYVGIGPKWVITRFRVLDAAAAAHSGESVDWAGLAHDLGFADQPHLTRVFTQVVGTPPATYARQA